jgi:hypothetical protein
VVRLAPCRASSEGQQQTTAAAAAPASSGPVEYVQDSEFNISKISFGAILTPLGLALMVYGFGAYFTLLPGTDVSSVLLIYGFPITILGFALNYAQLPPVPCKTTKDAFNLRGSQMTDIQKQVREDTTRFRCVSAGRGHLQVLLLSASQQQQQLDSWAAAASEGHWVGWTSVRGLTRVVAVETTQ